MQQTIKDLTVAIPMPIFVVVEDVGWWQGADGSANNEPFRNGFPRRHCLNDYRALVRLAKRLKMRIALGMVLGEWDRSNVRKPLNRVCRCRAGRIVSSRQSHTGTEIIELRPAHGQRSVELFLQE